MTSFVFIFLLLWGPPQLPAEPPTGEDRMTKAESLYREGSTLYEAADYPGAVRQFTAALSLVAGGASPEEEAIKRSLLWNIAIAHERAFGIDHDVRHLRQAKTLYGSYMGMLAKDETDARSEAEKNLARVEEMLTDHEKAQASTPTVSEKPVVLPPVAEPQKPIEQRHRSLKRGVGFVVPGVGSVVAGAVLLGIGSTYGDKAQAQVDMLDDLGVPADDPAWDEGARFIEQERRKGRALMAAGGALVGVGAVLVGVGSYYLVKSSRKVRVAPTAGIFGVSLSGRF
jgi:hypothetical protein